jgi:hypothetical protein
MHHIRGTIFALLISFIVVGPAHAQKQPHRVNGSCGAAANVAVTTAPTTNLCSAGTPSTVIGHGGATAICLALLASAPVNGQCGPANGVMTSTVPTSGLCSAGTSTGVSGSGPWSWGCTGSNGGTNATCSAPFQTASASITSITFPANASFSANGSNNVTVSGSVAVSTSDGSSPTMTLVVWSRNEVARVNLED